MDGIQYHILLRYLVDFFIIELRPTEEAENIVAEACYSTVIFSHWMTTFENYWILNFKNV